MRRIIVLMTVALAMAAMVAMPAFAQGSGGGGTPDVCGNSTETTLDCTGGQGSGGSFGPSPSGGIGGGGGSNDEIDTTTGEGVLSGGSGGGGDNTRPGGGGHHCTGDFDDPDPAAVECVGGGGAQPR